MRLKSRIMKLENKKHPHTEMHTKGHLIEIRDNIKRIRREKNLAVLSPEDREIYLKQDTEQEAWKRNYVKKRVRKETGELDFSEIQFRIEARKKKFKHHYEWRKMKGCFY